MRKVVTVAEGESGTSATGSTNRIGDESEHRCIGCDASRNGRRSYSSGGGLTPGPRRDGKSRMRRKLHVRFCEGRAVKFFSPTRLVISLGNEADARGVVDALPTRSAKYASRLSSSVVFSTAEGNLQR